MLLYLLRDDSGISSQHLFPFPREVIGVFPHVWRWDLLMSCPWNAGEMKFYGSQSPGKTVGEDRGGDCQKLLFGCINLNIFQIARSL